MQLAGTLVSWDQLVKRHRLLHPQNPDFWHEPLYTTPAGNSSSQDQCRQDTDGNSEHPSKHQVRQAQPSTTGINSEMQEDTNAGLVPDTVGNTGPGRGERWPVRSFIILSQGMKITQEHLHSG